MKNHVSDHCEHYKKMFDFLSVTFCCCCCCCCYFSCWLYNWCLLQFLLFFLLEHPRGLRWKQGWKTMSAITVSVTIFYWLIVGDLLLLLLLLFMLIIQLKFIAVPSLFLTWGSKWIIMKTDMKNHVSDHCKCYRQISTFCLWNFVVVVVVVVAFHVDYTTEVYCSFFSFSYLSTLED